MGMERRVEVVVAYMETHLRQQVTLDEVAPLVNLSPSRFRHVFKAETGLSLKQHQKQLRMQKARELLEDSFLTIKEIMIETGIRDRNHFARSFRKTFGTTPSEHRRLVAAQRQIAQHKAAAGSTAK
jgi:two-component system response regulator YesN